MFLSIYFCFGGFHKKAETIFQLNAGEKPLQQNRFNDAQKEHVNRNTLNLILNTVQKKLIS